MATTPMFSYMKNAFMRRYVKQGLPAYDGIKYLFEDLLDLPVIFNMLGLEYFNMLDEPGVFSFEKFPRYVETFCE